ncbi:MAG: DUF1801 domain-containing protein [Hyphomicrobiaceae bacterium]|nr:DUF1801 domain-containing protein [Hyphomicrobiaceae bacterium]
MSRVPAMPIEVAQCFEAFPPRVQKRLKAVRRMIFDVAEAQGVGPLIESIKWGEPAYVPAASKTGTTVRLGWHARTPEVCRVLVNCRTTLVATYRELYGSVLAFEGQRAIALPVCDEPSDEALRHCIALALTYHRSKSRSDS